MKSLISIFCSSVVLKRKLNQEELVSGKTQWQERKELKQVVSPSRRTRQQEKEELQHLNDRFITYIGHNKRIREEKERVDSAFEHLQTTSLEESTKVKRVYNRELEDARLLIDEIAIEKA